MAQFDLSRRGLLALTGAAAAIAGPGTGLAATARPARLFSTDVGAGRNVMLLHGWTCDSHDWIWQLPVLESRYRVVAVDLRGHGRSEVMPPGAYTPADYVADIESLIATAYAGQAFVLVGHSMGGQIAACLAARRPDLVSAVVSVDGAVGLSSDLAPVFQKTVDDLNAGNPGVVGPALFELFYDAATDPAYRRWHARRFQGTPLHVVRESFGPLFLGAGQVGIGKPSEDFLRGLNVPFYHLSRNPAQAGPMRSWLSHPKSKVDLWTGAGHWIMQDRKDDVNAALVAWIDAL
ncbi:alpha/beta fold hydrolase [Inquilinus sp. NPDC058860]|uniref:alpha/beta fold hydrolase n=1 Tax=Inquilinus sp. NPDC058860 TaxID=3346652 RepID=UPI0036801F71